jgi:hypothetical protein
MSYGIDEDPGMVRAVGARPSPLGGWGYPHPLAGESGAHEL